MMRGLDDDAGPALSDESFESIKEEVRERSGLNIGDYKDKCIKRRIAVRMRARRTLAGDEYLRLLKTDAGEFEKLLTALTINVTQFFRNYPAFEEIRQTVLPALFGLREREKEHFLRIWSAGCSSGEEPYTIAILLKEYFRRELDRFDVQIVASDFDDQVIRRALQGVYDVKCLEEMPPPLREKYFTPEKDGRVRLNDEIRKMVLFRQKNILEEKMLSEQDLVLCRNMLIYFTRDQQEKVLLGLSGALRHGGFLVLGKAETLVAESRRHFRPVCIKERIYQKI